VLGSVQRIVQANGIGLCVQTFGEAASPAILLVSGAAASMDWWEDEFCERLAAGPTGPGDPGLPPMSDELRARFEEPLPEPDWSDRQAVVDYMVEGLRPFAGAFPFDQVDMRALAGRIFDRTVNIESSVKNH
jgi:hypothetical protein